jgi:hypothetical protein
MCWGHPQDCRGPWPNSPNRGGGALPAPSSSIIKRYFCKRLPKPEEVGHCDFESYARTCQEAAKQVSDYYARMNGNPCRRCGNVIDNSLSTVGSETIGGTCPGF